MKSTSVGNLNGSQINRVRKFPWNSEGHEPVTVYEVVKDRVETRQFPRKSFFPIDVDSQNPVQSEKPQSPVRKSRSGEGERGDSEHCAHEESSQLHASQPSSPQHHHRHERHQSPQQDPTVRNAAALQMHHLLKRNQEEINYLKEQIKVKDAKICELEAIVKQLTLRNWFGHNFCLAKVQF